MSEFLPAIRHARIKQLNIYEISDSELRELEQGSPDSLFLNFAIFLLSVAISLLMTLSTTAISSQKTFIVFVVLTSVGFIGGFVLLSLWLWHRKLRSSIFKEIRSRLPPDGVPQNETLILD